MITVTIAVTISSVLLIWPLLSRFSFCLKLNKTERTFELHIGINDK